MGKETEVQGIRFISPGPIKELAEPESQAQPVVPKRRSESSAWALTRQRAVKETQSDTRRQGLNRDTNVYKR